MNYPTNSTVPEPLQDLSCQLLFLSRCRVMSSAVFMDGRSERDAETIIKAVGCHAGIFSVVPDATGCWVVPAEFATEFTQRLLSLSTPKQRDDFSAQMLGYFAPKHALGANPITATLSLPSGTVAHGEAVPSVPSGPSGPSGPSANGQILETTPGARAHLLNWQHRLHIHLALPEPPILRLVDIMFTIMDRASRLDDAPELLMKAGPAFSGILYAVSHADKSTIRV